MRILLYTSFKARHFAKRLSKDYCLYRDRELIRRKLDAAISSRVLLSFGAVIG